MRRRKLFLLFTLASCVMLALPAKAWTDSLETAEETVGRKTLPYPFATDAIPASAMEYDSVANCFVVRDTIMSADARSRSGAAPTVVTRAAVAYTEDGVKYGYFGDQLSSDDMTEMKQIVESWATNIPNIDIDGVLSPAPDQETWYMQIVGVDNDVIDDNGGEMRIYNDIGTAYNYKTIAIDSVGLRNNEHIKTVVFEDCASASANANTDLKMVVHNGAFKGCENLKEFNMYYLVTEGTNHYQMLYPWDVYIGDDVFDGCHEDFRIVVSPEVYEMFIYDDNWSKYADKIVASDYMPTVHEPITVDGVTYDYASSALNTLPTSELIRLQSSWWNAAIIGVEVAVAIATYGTANASLSATKASTALTNASAQEVYKQAMKISASYVGKTGFKYTSQAALVASDHLVKTIMASNLAVRKATIYAAMSVVGATAGSPAGINGLGYISSTIGNKVRRDPTWTMHGQWLMTENKHTIYHMYVSDVANQETVKLYNDIGSAYNYKTVAIGKTAFHNKTNIKTVKFEDLYSSTAEMYAPLNIVIPDSAFMGCTNLELLDLIMCSTDTDPDRNVPLGPENFIVCGEDLFVGCDTAKLKIRIGADKYEEFAENPVWGKYKNCFEVVDVPEVIDFTDYGAQYSYSFEDNSLKKQSYTGGHTIEHLHIIGQNGDMESQKGELGLFNDIGIVNNYKLDYVKGKAFYGSKELTGISMFDLKGWGGTGDAYTDLELVLQDSAFACCPNLEYINMLYFRTDGGNTVEAMSPDRVLLGDGVFAGSDKLKIKMVTSAVESFKADTTWVKYEDKFLPSFILTKDETLMDVLEECGMEYESPITGGSFDIYDVMKVTDPSTLNGKFQAKEIGAFHEFKAFECINLNYIGESWFKDCKKLQAIELPSTIETIGKQAFNNCAVLDDVVIPNSVNAIQDEAFKNCANLRIITFQSAIPATLGTDVFADMPEDYVIYVPDSVVTTYKEAWPQYADHIQSAAGKHTGIWEVTAAEAGTLAKELGLTITGTNPLDIEGNYSKYDKLKITGPINGTDIGVIRFMGGRDVNNCDDIYPRNLKYLDLYDADIKAGGEDYNQDGSNDRITEDNCIDTYMFWELDVLETLILPKSVTKIKDYAFNNCDVLSRVVIGDNTKSIGAKVTHDSYNLQEVILLCNEAPATDADAWSDELNVGIFYTPNSYRDHISGSRVYYTRGDSIASPFKDDTLMRALAEKRIYTANDLTTLKDVENLINGNSEIKQFNELIMAVEVKELGDNSLSGCSSLEEVTLPYCVETISAGAFNGCTSLMSVNVHCDSIPTLAENAFENLPKDFVIYVTVGKEDAYRKAWPQYADHIQGFKVVKDEVRVVTVTAPGTLADELGFTVSMASSNDVGRIGGDLIGITALKVNGPINGKDIAVLRMLGGRDEEDAEEVILARMTYLDLYDATICTDPENICFNRDGVNDYVEFDNEIPEHMFWKLDRLKTVILPKNVTKIDENAFYDCLNLETIIVGDSTAYIGNDAFGECPNLKNILFLCKEKPTLHDDAFTDPVSDQPYQVEKMYVPLSLYNSYVADREFTTHTKEFSANYEEDDLFRAYGSRAVMSNDQLRAISNINGWFDHHNDITDLTSLGKSAIDSLSSTTLSSLARLQKITLPATLAVVEEDAFAANTKLLWADFSQCTNEGVITQANMSQLGINPYALVYAPDNMTVTGLANVVYGTDGNLKCDRLEISDSAASSVLREFTASAVRYDRLFTAGERTTLSLPFAMEVPSGVRAYEMVGDIDEAILISPVDRMEANMPYVVVTDADMTLSANEEVVVPVTPIRMPQVKSSCYTMSGTQTAISVEEAVKQRLYVFGDNDAWNLTVNASEGEQAMLPYRAYIQATQAGMPHSVQMYEAIDRIDIVDGASTEFVNLEEKFVSTLTYTRTINGYKWNALYLPFQLELTEEFFANYDVAYINEVRSYDNDTDGCIDAWDVEIIKLNKPGKLKANYPYVIRPKNEDAVNLCITQANTVLHSTVADKQVAVTGSTDHLQYAVKGTYVKTVSADLNGGNYVYAVNKQGEWQKMALTTSLIPFRLYLALAQKDGSPIDLTTAQSVRMRVIDEESGDDATGINDFEATEQQGDGLIYDLLGRRVLNPKKGNIYIVNGRKVLF